MLPKIRAILPLKPPANRLALPGLSSWLICVIQPSPASSIPPTIPTALAPVLCITNNLLAQRVLHLAPLGAIFISDFDGLHLRRSRSSCRECGPSSQSHKLPMLNQWRSAIAGSVFIISRSEMMNTSSLGIRSSYVHCVFSCEPLASGTLSPRMWAAYRSPSVQPR